jgi:polyisoprenoid-binding protein YceI
VRSVELQVPADGLACGNGTMNAHMLRALEATAHPTITFAVETYDLARADDAVRVTLNGTLTMGGVGRPISVVARATEDSSGAVRFVGSHELRMTEWGLTPPSLMHGTMNADERIKVRFDLLFKE